MCSSDLKAFQDFVEWQIQEGSHGLVPCGTTGESPTLTHDEHKRVVELCVEVAKGRVPVIAALHGAVVGGGLELASACHIRVADSSTFYALPEGSRGIFVGGGGSVRIPRLIGTARMTDMMLTGRVFDADQGERYGAVNYRVADGAGLAKGIELARKIEIGRAHV